MCRYASWGFKWLLGVVSAVFLKIASKTSCSVIRFRPVIDHAGAPHFGGTGPLSRLPPLERRNTLANRKRGRDRALSVRPPVTFFQPPTRKPVQRRPLHAHGPHSGCPHPFEVRCRAILPCLASAWVLSPAHSDPRQGAVVAWTVRPSSHREASRRFRWWRRRC